MKFSLKFKIHFKKFVSAKTGFLLDFTGLTFRDALDTDNMDLKTDFDCASKDERDESPGNENIPLDDCEAEAKEVSSNSYCQPFSVSFCFQVHVHAVLKRFLRSFFPSA